MHCTVAALRSHKEVIFYEFLGRKQKCVWLPNKGGRDLGIFESREMSDKVMSDEW